MVVANRQGWLFRQAPAAKRRVLWLHDTANRLRRVRERAAIAWYTPVLVPLSAFHQRTIPRSLWGATAITIPLAPAELFKGATERAAAPKPRALFTSNPVRGLEKLLDLWARHIRPVVPEAELHLFGGAQTYQIRKGRRASSTIGRTLEAARGLVAAGIVVHDPAPRPVLRDHLSEARALLYPYPADETYCLAAAEAQAMGVPAVLGEAGCLSERVIDGVTGFLTRSDAEFVDRSVRVLTGDSLWLNMHRECLARQRSRSWDDVAADFEALL
jgi:glycosyltransferase involved in cell wall biosynthesis